MRAAPQPSAAIIDVGGGESTLIDDLFARGYSDLTVLDISQTVIDANRKRLGSAAGLVRWLAADITQVELDAARYDLWHDRAVFHFLTSADDRRAYVRQVARAVRQGGYVIVSTFGPEGPTKCSGLEVFRYDAESLHQQFGVRFRLLDSSQELHETRPARCSSSFTAIAGWIGRHLVPQLITTRGSTRTQRSVSIFRYCAPANRGNCSY